MALPASPFNFSVQNDFKPSFPFDPIFKATVEGSFFPETRFKPVTFDPKNIVLGAYDSRLAGLMGETMTKGDDFTPHLISRKREPSSPKIKKTRMAEQPDHPFMRAPDLEGLYGGDGGTYGVFR